MTNWKCYKVSEFAEVIGGGTPKTGVAEYWNGDIPWITPKDLSSHQARRIARGERNITQEGLKNSSARVVPANTVLLTSRAPVGYLAIAQNEVATNQGFRNLVVKEGFSPEFVYYLLLNNVDYLKQHASGSTFQELSGGTLKNLEFQIPEYATQKQIAKILGDLDEQIELNHQMNKTLEAMAQALFKEWFINTSGSREIVTVSQFVEFDPSTTVKKGAVIPYVDMGELSAEGMTVGTVILKAFAGGSKFQNGDTLLARITPCLENGKTAYVGFLEDQQTGFGSTEFIVMRAKIGVSPQFVYCLARDPEFRSFAIQSMVGSSGRQRVQRDMLEGFEIMKPHQSLMKKFHKATEPLFRQISKNCREASAVSQIRDSLLPKLMAGEITA